jgi:hypothetical protein
MNRLQHLLSDSTCAATAWHTASTPFTPPPPSTSRRGGGAHNNHTTDVEWIKLSVGVTGCPEILETEGQITQGSSSGRTLGESVCGIFELDCSDWSNGI